MNAAAWALVLLLSASGCGSSPPASTSANRWTAPSAGGGGIDFRRAGWTGPVLDQAFVGACSAFSVSAVMNSKLRVQGRAESVSTMHVWAELKLRSGMAEDLVNVAVAPSEAWAYDPVKACLIASPTDECAKAGYRPGSGQLDPAINLEWARANLAERHRVVDVESIYSSSSDSTHTDKEVLFRTLAAGEAIDATVLVGDGFWSPGPVLGDYYVDDNSGGHGVALVGFRYGAQGRELLIQNSWGASWGDGGFVWMPEQMIGKQLINARRISMIDAHAAIPQSNACDGWNRRDLVLDACYVPCRNNVPTVNGRCNPLPANSQSELACLDPREVLSGRCVIPGTQGGVPSLQGLGLQSLPVPFPVSLPFQLGGT